MIRAVAALLVLVGPVLAADPACAVEIEENEALVMRITFDECLGYVNGGPAPFADLPTRPATAAQSESLGSAVPNRDRAVELLAPRYVALWGDGADVRFCMVRSVWDAASQGLPAKLGVRADGFADRIAARAAREGLTQIDPDATFSPLYVLSVQSPPTGVDTGPGRNLRLTILATTEVGADGLADAGIIIVTGPPRR